MVKIWCLLHVPLEKITLSNTAVDFRSRRFAFRGAGAEPPRRFAPAGSHLTSCARRSLRAFHYNQQGLISTFSFNRAKKTKDFCSLTLIFRKYHMNSKILYKTSIKKQAQVALSLLSGSYFSISARTDFATISNSSGDRSVDASI
jgi:hypothetical protein